MRLMETKQDLEAYLYLLHAMNQKGLIEILEESEPHKNRGNFITLPYLFGNQIEHGDAVTH